MLEKLVQQQMAIPTMAPVREILIATAPTQRGVDMHKPHSVANALALIKIIQSKLKAGESFAYLATHYSEDPLTRSQGGDLGIIWTGADGFNNAVWPSIENLRSGQITSAPVKTSIGYIMAQVVSTSANPLPSDEAMYSAGVAQYRRNALDQDVPEFMDHLRQEATITKYAFN
jgi:parvulin-like peptidyl-prolyl isomerase